MKPRKKIMSKRNRDISINSDRDISINSDRDAKIHRKIKGKTQRVCRRVHEQVVNDMISADSSSKKIWFYIKSEVKF